MDDLSDAMIQGWRICVRVGMPVALILGMIGSFGLRELRAAEPSQHSLKSISEQSERPGADRFAIYPHGITLTANQRQRFGVIDATGKLVAVHWNVSGLNCSGLACGTIDDNGDYLAPDSVTSAQIIVLEGVLVSDPKHSVLTRISLAPTEIARGTTDNSPVTVAEQTSSARNNQPANSRINPEVHSAGPVFQAPVGRDASPKRRPAVTYQGGQLTIDVENVTLAEVLKLIARETGVVIDIPSGTGLERIVEHAGPAPANEVLTQLLNGSRFNFVIVNSPQTPNELAQVILTLRGAETTTSPVFSAQASSLTASPTETIPPDVLERMMKDKAREIRENAQQQ